ncbi:MAG: hypothetical protein HQL80_05230 [Magnetococcales bacterium]|nr:hypothetical protein [Magnetococcales bacterium]
MVIVWSSLAKLAGKIYKFLNFPSWMHTKTTRIDFMVYETMIKAEFAFLAEI